LRSGKSNTNGNASSECDTHRYGNADCFTDCKSCADSATSSQPSTAPDAAMKDTVSVIRDR